MAADPSPPPAAASGAANAGDATRSLRPQARGAARIAAARAGMPLDDWLHYAILLTAAEQLAPTAGAAATAPVDASAQQHGAEIAALRRDLTALTSRLERLERPKSGDGGRP